MANKKKNKKSSSGKSTKARLAKSGKPSKRRSKPKKAAKPKALQRRGRQRGPSAPGEIVVSHRQRGLGTSSGGQAGDTQGIRAGADVSAQGVEELLEEGQTFEAEVVDGVENAPDPDQGEVRTREVSEDDVPEEDREPDEYRPKN